MSVEWMVAEVISGRFVDSGVSKKAQPPRVY